MPVVHKRAKDLTTNDILAAARGHGAMSIKQIYISRNPATGTTEVTIKGPLGIVDKLDENAVVSVLQ